MNSFESANAFARRGIVGLKSTATVLLYARAWLDRFPRPPIGARVDLPAEVWPPTRTGTDGYSTEEGAARTIARIVEKHGVDAVAKAVQADVNVRRAVRDAIDAGDREHDPRPPRITDRGKTADELNEDAYWVKVRAALHLLLDVKVKISQGVTVPGDIAILMELLVPETDWDEALRQEIGNLS